jgi:hypothetical protein
VVGAAEHQRTVRAAEAEQLDSAVRICAARLAST